nr:hypothetical protein [Saprospiraceae bacterium]
MKKKLNSVYLLFGVLLAAFFQMSSSSNPSNGYTGAPPSGNTCSSSQGGCHAGPAGSGAVSIDGLPSSVTPLTVYPITVTMERNNASVSLGGFQLVAQLSNNANAGVMSNPGPNTTIQFTGNKYYVEHTSAAGFSGDIITFTCDWTSPATATGPITMYVAANFANGNGSTSGDGVATATASTTLASTGGVIGVTVNGTNVSCAGGNNGAATALAAGGGGGPYSFAWSNGDNDATITGLTAGTYTVTVTNAVGGNGTGSVTITQPSPLNVNITNQTDVDCTNPMGSATAQANGGVGSYTYLWPNGQTSPTAMLSPGTHIVTATDGNGCQATASVNIMSNTTAPVANAGQPVGLSCGSATASLNGSGSSVGADFQYLWTTINGNIVSGANTLNPVVNETGTYTLTVTNLSNGCTASDETTVTGSTSIPNSNAGPDALLTCATPQLQLNGSLSSTGTGFSYLWTTANGNIVSGGTTLTPTVNQPGTYCLTVTNLSNSCSATDCAIVTSNTAAPLANAGSASSLTCSVSQVTLNGTASSQGSNFSYQWTTTNGNIVSGATTLNPVVSIAATYTLTVTNATNGCTDSDNVTVTTNTTPPTANAGPDKAFTCNSSSVVLDGSGSSQGGNISYQWSGPGIVSGGNTPNPTVNVPGNYSLLVTNAANGCTSTDVAIASQPPTLVASISASQNVACNGTNTGSATAAGTGGNGAFTYLWSNSATTAQITGIAAGTYTVTVKDADNCTATASVTITQPPVLNPNASATGVAGIGINNGTATASPMGGVPGYTFLWNNASGANVGTTPSIINLAPGNYTVTVTDGNNCTASQTVTVASFSCAGFGANMASTNPSCNGGSNGTATATPSGGASPFNYVWSTGATTSSISGLTAGSYTVSVTDQSGCVVTGNVSLVSPSALNLAVQQTAIPCNGSNLAGATVNVTGGTPGYTYVWSNGGTGASQNNLPAGSYTISVTDANGCTANVQASLVELPALAGNLTASAESGVNANDGTVSVAMTAGIAPFQYVWTNGATTSAITNLQPGNYCVSVTDAFGCTFTGCATVAAFGCAGQALSVTAGNVSCAGSSDGTAQVSATGFQSPITYAWANAAGSIIGTGSAVANLGGGSYSVSVSGADGCQSTQGFTITEPTALAISVLTQNNIECAGELDGSLTVGGTGGTPGYDYAWSNGATTPTIAGLGAGSYTVVV